MAGALGVGYFIGRPPSPTAPPPAAAPTLNPGPAAPAAAPADPPSARTQVVRFDWRHVESADYREYIANLRAVGCPDATVRDIIVADVTQLFAERAREHLRRLGPYEYWRTDSRSLTQSVAGAWAEAKAKFEQERRAVIDALLGPGTAALSNHLTGLEDFDPRLDFLPASRQRGVQTVEQAFAWRRARLLAAGGEEDPFQQMTELAARREEELGRLLSADELEAYEMRTSELAAKLRGQLRDIPLDSGEFREVHRLMREHQKQYPPWEFNLFNNDRLREIGEAEARRDEAIRRVLGEERFQKFHAMAQGQGAGDQQASE